MRERRQQRDWYAVQAHLAAADHPSALTRVCVAMPSHPVIERLVRDHDQHLKALQREFRGWIAPDEAEDILQIAYTRGFVQLTDPARKTPNFESYDAERAWLHTIAWNVARDEDRHLKGRRPETRAKRPTLVNIDTPDGPLPVLDDDAFVEDDALDAVERDQTQAMGAQALATLDPKHQQILKLLFSDNLKPQAIMYLEGLTEKQWNGRRERAIAAFARAVAKINVTLDCGQFRLLLKRQPQALLDSSDVSTARDHIETCLACQGFAQSTRKALAVMPLPFPLIAWKLDAMQYVTPAQSGRRALRRVPRALGRQRKPPSRTSSRRSLSAAPRSSAAPPR